MKHPVGPLQVFQEACRAVGWSWPAPKHLGKDAPDALLQIQSQEYLVEIRYARAARLPELQALLADAALQAQARVKKQLGAKALPVIFAPRISPAMLVQLDQYVRKFIPSRRWGAFDLAGLWHFPGLLADGAPPLRHRGDIELPRRPQPRHDPFSDLGQWLAKVVLAPSIPERWLSAPRNPSASLRQLASSAQVSLPTAARWAGALRERNYLDPAHQPGRQALALSRRLEFLDIWAGALRLKPLVEQPVRSHVGGNPAQVLQRISAKFPDATLGLFAACDALKLGIARGVPQHVYLNSWNAQDLAELGLAPAQTDSPYDLILRQPLAPESLRRGRVRAGKHWCADVLQCYVDLVHFPARGAEQALAIRRRLGWQTA